MNKPKISPDFTIEDIHRIREANEERRQAMTKEAYRAEVRADALFIQEKILKIKEKRLSQNKSHSQIPHYPASSSREHTSVPAGDC
ncbi:hypothetical protein [uncultured Fretibacterium sp.]|uniref:hypothetical protein n=2 Tax=uncultured Fretibacterium sp. TaxID=1678694 RepID=UPI0028DC4B22|nr:hypothetical protein [uncultured Fretibacterium sp.]